MPPALRWTTYVTTLAGLVALAGCGSGDTAVGGSVSQPDTVQSATVQKAAAPVDAIAISSKAALDAIIKSGTGQTVSTDDDGGGGGGQAAATNFTFANSGTLTVNLDTSVGGQDLYPNASGSIQVVFNGSAVVSQPVGNNGNAGYDVTVTFLSASTFRNPVTGAVATVNAGSNYQFAADIDWTRNTLTNDWSITISGQLGTTGFNASVLDAGVTTTAAITGNRRVTTRLAVTAGAFSFSHDVVANWTGVFTQAGVTHTVLIDRPAFNTIFVTVDGTRFGPFTAFQAAVIWKCSFD